MSDTAIAVAGVVELRVLAEKLHEVLLRPLIIGRDVTQHDLDVIKRCGDLAHEIEVTR